MSLDWIWVEFLYDDQFFSICMPTCFKYRLDHLPLYEFIFAIYCLIVYFYEIPYLCCNACAFLKVAFLNLAFSEFQIHKSNKWVKYLGAIDSIVNGQVKMKNKIIIHVSCSLDAWKSSHNLNLLNWVSIFLTKLLTVNSWITNT